MSPLNPSKISIAKTQTIESIFTADIIIGNIDVNNRLGLPVIDNIVDIT